MKLLIIEDEQELREVLITSLKEDVYVVESACDYKEALYKIEDYNYDCILLDIMLPGGNGLALLERLKQLQKSNNVIIISAKDSLDDKLKGLELGADDYLTKPFHIAELRARIKAVLRRNNLGGSNQIKIANIVLDMDQRALFINDALVHLNRKEFDLLYYFLINMNRLITKNVLAEYVWGDYIDQADNYDFIYYQVKNLRKKLKDEKAGIALQSVYGVGYKMIEI